MYTFPEIETLDDILPAIKDRKEFSVFDKGDYTVVKYNVAFEDTFKGENAHLKREARGLVFDKKGKLISRPYHKFFNVNELEETQYHKLPWNAPHIILDKVDGSMVRPLLLPDTNGVRLATKAGITNVALKAEEYLYGEMEPKYASWLYTKAVQGFTPILEWWHPENAIVVNYGDKPFFVLTAMRETVTGKYVPLDQIDTPFDKVNVVDWEYLDRNQGIEGVVVRWHNGHMVKVKTEWYVRLHKLKDKFDNDFALWQTFVNGELDDILAMLLPTDKKKLNAKLIEIQHVLDLNIGLIRRDIDRFGNTDQKIYALSEDKVCPPHLQRYVFDYIRKGKEVLDNLTMNVYKDMANNKKGFEKCVRIM